MKTTAILAAALSLLSCGPRLIVCPDGETVSVLRSVEDVFPAYAKEYEVNFRAASSQLDNFVAETSVSTQARTRLLKLRQDLDQERAALQERLKTMTISLQTTPCDKEVRKTVLALQGEIRAQADKIPTRANEARSIRIQEMKGSPGGVQVDSVTINHFSEPSGHQMVNRYRSEVEKLLRFPDAVKEASNPPTQIEKLLINRLPYRLFNLLLTYDESDVVQIPKVGEALKTHIGAYYLFRQKVLRVEETLMMRIGRLVKVRFRQGWEIYLKYAILRFSSHSKESIIAGGDFLNYDITWDDAERVFELLSREPLISNEVSEIFTMHKALIQDVNKIAASI